MVGPYERTARLLNQSAGASQPERNPSRGAGTDLSTTTTLITQQLRTGSPNLKALIFLMLDHHVYIYICIQYFALNCFLGNVIFMGHIFYHINQLPINNSRSILVNGLKPPARFQYIYIYIASLSAATFTASPSSITSGLSALHPPLIKQFYQMKWFHFA